MISKRKLPTFVKKLLNEIFEKEIINYVPNEVFDNCSKLLINLI